MYEEAVGKILLAQAREGAIRISIDGGAGDTQLFAAADYGESVSKINSMAASGGEKVSAALSLQQSGSAELAEKQLRGGLEKTEKGIEALLLEMEKDISRMGKERARQRKEMARASAQADKAPGPQAAAVPDKKAAQRSEEERGERKGLGSLLSRAEKDIGRSTEKIKRRGKDQKGGTGLADLSVADQITGLEAAALKLMDKSAGEEEREAIAEDARELDSGIKSEKALYSTDFEAKMLELRNRRLREVMELLAGGTHS